MSAEPGAGHYAALQEKVPLQPSNVVNSLTDFYAEVDAGSLNQDQVAGIYYKAAIQANNDRLNRVRRGLIVGALLRDIPLSQIQQIITTRDATD